MFHQLTLPHPCQKLHPVPQPVNSQITRPDDVPGAPPAKKRLGWKEDPPRTGWRVDNAKEYYGTVIHSAVPDRYAHWILLTLGTPISHPTERCAHWSPL